MHRPALTRDQCREIDRLAVERYGIPSIVLMENAGRGCADVLERLGIDGPVVIRVGASSFNYHDVFTVRGMPGIKVPLPVVIGLDMAGEISEVGPGVSISIPTSTHFQFRCDGHEALVAIGATMPPWPGEGEAYPVEGKWQPTVRPRSDESVKRSLGISGFLLGPLQA